MLRASRPGRRVAIVAGVRTPFAEERHCLPGRDRRGPGPPRRARAAVSQRDDGREVDEVIFSQVVPSVLAPNVAREVSLLPQLLPSVPAYTLNRACASAPRRSPTPPTRSCSATPTRSSPAAWSRSPTSRSCTRAASARSWWTRARRRASAAGSRRSAAYRPRDLVPVTPAIAEPSTGETMGQSAEKMAKENGITREAQDELALDQPPARRRGYRRRPAHARRSRPGSAVPRWIRPSTPTTASAPTPRSRRSPRSSRCSTGSTARSPPATRRRSPTAPPPCC